MTNYVFFNHQIMPSDQAHISISDLGFLRGYGVFDVASATKQNVFKLEEHIERLEKSAESLNLKLPFTKNKIKELALSLLHKNNFDHSSIRFVLTGGVSANNRTIDKESFLIINEEAHLYPKEFYTDGVSVITREFKRSNPCTKSLNYQFAYSIYQTEPKEDAFEILYINNNCVLEGATSNLFIVKNNQLITPIEDILLGITRNEVLRLAKMSGLNVTERAITKEELFEADEVFITATFKKIMPVVKIDREKVGDGKPGPITKNLIELFDKE